MRLLARIIKELPPQSGTSEKGEWTRQEFIIETLTSQYPDRMLVSVFGTDKLQRLNLQTDQVYDFNLSFSAREWKDRYFNSIDVFSASPHQTTLQEQPSQVSPQTDPLPFTEFNPLSDDDKTPF